MIETGETPKVREAMDSMKKQLVESGMPEKRAEQVVQKSARRYDDGQGARKK